MLVVILGIGGLLFGGIWVGLLGALIGACIHAAAKK